MFSETGLCVSVERTQEILQLKPQEINFMMENQQNEKMY